MSAAQPPYSPWDSYSAAPGHVETGAANPAPPPPYTVDPPAVEPYPYPATLGGDNSLSPLPSSPYPYAYSGSAPTPSERWVASFSLVPSSCPVSIVPIPHFVTCLLGKPRAAFYLPAIEVVSWSFIGSA